MHRNARTLVREESGGKKGNNSKQVKTKQLKEGGEEGDQVGFRG